MKGLGIGQETYRTRIEGLSSPSAASSRISF